MTEEIQVSVSPETAADSQRLASYIARLKAIDVRTIRHIRILRRSIDARQRRILVNLSLRVYVNEEPTDEAYRSISYPNVADRPSVVVVGEGPGGLFASLRLIEFGFRPVVVERGKDVHERKKDLSLITKTQRVDAESNYSFGEGGAGAYSDGKLYTRSKKRGNVDRILNIFCQHFDAKVRKNTNCTNENHQFYPSPLDYGKLWLGYGHAKNRLPRFRDSRHELSCQLPRTIAPVATKYRTDCHE